MQISGELILEWLDKLLEDLQKGKIIEPADSDWPRGFNSGLDQAINEIGRLKSDISKMEQAGMKRKEKSC